MDNNRYIRQTLLERIGENGQQKLNDACVAIVGCGGLGSIAAPYLAGAGVGHLILIDGDIPDVTNLHRQVFFSEHITKKTKAAALAEHITKLNSQIKVTIKNEMISKENISTLLKDAQIVLECTDNIYAKYLVNDFCHINRKPVSYGAIHKYDGFLSFFENMDDDSIHLRDIFPEPNTNIATCSEVGVLGTIAGIIGLMQANEAIKYITKAGECMIGKLLSYDILSNNQIKLGLKKSYTAIMEKTYASSDYAMEISCQVNEIRYSEILKNRSDYEMISILPDNEHQSIDELVIRQPLSSFDFESWQPFSDKVHVFYCMSGIRSQALVGKLISNDNNAKVFSLKGGLKTIID